MDQTDRPAQPANRIEGGAFIGPKAVSVFRGIVLANALRLYARTKMLTTRGATPSRLMRMAAEITGKRFKARDYLGAAAAVESWSRGTAEAVHLESFDPSAPPPANPRPPDEAAHLRSES